MKLPPLALVPVIVMAAVPVAAQRAGTAKISPLDRPQRVAEGSVPVPVFTDPGRRATLTGGFPEVERIFTRFKERRQIPGAAFGVVIDGELAWAKGLGVRDVTSGAAVDVDTVFRIASMTKSFTAMAILRLRDEGRLSLDDPVARYVPELGGLLYPTRDAPVLTIRHLLTHSAGFPEDNPWGDRQLAVSDDTMGAWLRAGLPFSTVPGTAYEYSNYGFALLGRVVARASGHPYSRYVEANILRPLGMNATTFDVAKVPADRLAKGYGRQADRLQEVVLLPDGAFGPMGGLWTSARDLARYVGFLMAAFPPRDDPETGPVRRASLREMQQMWRFESATASRQAVDAPLRLVAEGYGYGLGASLTCGVGYLVAHGGGLPGFGSQMQWLPEHGVGLIAMGNLTYAGWGATFREAWEALSKTGGLRARAVRPSAALVAARDDVSRLINGWDEALARRIAADNLWLDWPDGQLKARFEDAAKRHGACRPAGEIEPENALRGFWPMACERGSLRVGLTLAPTAPPRVQQIVLRSALPLDARMTDVVETLRVLAGRWDAQRAVALATTDFDFERAHRQLEAVRTQWGACRVGDPLAGDGSTRATVRFACDRGALDVGLQLEAADRRLASLTIAPASDTRCVP
jgi:CubicO group peptidase (beta-lactamase class C family)